MKTNTTHDYHGVTLRNDGYGWTIQIKLMGKYRQLRTYASNPETAARRYDVALAKLEAFAEPTATPNFPNDFETVSTSRSDFQKSDGGLDFFDEMQSLFSTLCKEAEAAGLDPQEMEKHRKQIAQAKLEAARQKQKMARLKLSQHLLKAQATLPSCHLSVDKFNQIRIMLEQTQRIFDLAS